jgi:hypothetical protein
MLQTLVNTRILYHFLSLGLTACRPIMMAILEHSPPMPAFPSAIGAKWVANGQQSNCSDSSAAKLQPHPAGVLN